MFLNWPDPVTKNSPAAEDVVEFTSGLHVGQSVDRIDVQDVVHPFQGDDQPGFEGDGTA